MYRSKHLIASILNRFPCSSLAASLFLMLFVGSDGRCLASEARANSAGHIADGDGTSAPGGLQTGVTAASSETFSDFFGEGVDEYHSFATVNGSTLRAYAYAHQVNDNISVGGLAKATWIDKLTLSNPDVLLTYPTPNDVYVFFTPKAEGNGHNAKVELAGSVTDRGEPLFDDAEVVFGDDLSSGPLSLTFNGPATSLVDGVDFFLELTVTVSINDPGGTGEADYSHTAYLPPLFFGDINGNPIPGLAGLTFDVVGESGISYVTSTVPEVSTFLLTALALPAVWFGRGRTSRK